MDWFIRVVQRIYCSQSRISNRQKRSRLRVWACVVSKATVRKFYLVGEMVEGTVGVHRSEALKSNKILNFSFVIAINQGCIGARRVGILR